MQEKDKNKNEFGDKINDFIQRNRMVIFTISGLIIISLVALIVFISVKSNMDKKAAVTIEELQTRFDELKPDITDKRAEADILIADLETFAKKSKGVSGSKAWAIAADIYSDREEWNLAQEAFINAARAGEKTYLRPLSLLNAAAAAEEQGKTEQALDLLKQCLSINDIEFPAAPRAQFSVGRLNEQLGNNAAALEAYRVIISKWPQMPEWQQLARSRITVLEIK